MVSSSIITKGEQFARLTAALALCKGDTMSAAEFARRRWRDTPAVGECLMKMAAVAGGSPDDPEWASPLVTFGLAEDFLLAVRARTVIDRLAGVRRAPFRTRVPLETSGGAGAWIGAGGVIPLSRSQFENVALASFKAAVLIALTGELLQSLSAAAMANIRDSLVKGVAEYLDAQFLDPSIAAIGTTSPASITYGGIEVTSTGESAAAVEQDLTAMIAASQEDLISPAWVMRSRTCAHIASRLKIPDIKLNGGSLFGIPIIATKSQATPPGSPVGARYVTMLDADAVLLADDGNVDVSMSSVTSLSMVDDPSGAQEVVSLFQTGGAAARVVREIAWKRARDTAAVYMEVAY